MDRSHGAWSQESLAVGDFEGLRRVARRYFHSLAGYEASLLLAGYEADRGRHLTAALTYQQLLDIPKVAARFQPQLSLLAAVSWTALENQERASELLQELDRQGFFECPDCRRKASDCSRRKTTARLATGDRWYASGARSGHRTSMAHAPRQRSPKWPCRRRLASFTNALAGPHAGSSSAGECA